MSAIWNGTSGAFLLRKVKQPRRCFRVVGGRQTLRRSVADTDGLSNRLVPECLWGRKTGGGLSVVAAPTARSNWSCLFANFQQKLSFSRSASYSVSQHLRERAAPQNWKGRVSPKQEEEETTQGTAVPPFWTGTEGKQTDMTHTNRRFTKPLMGGVQGSYGSASLSGCHSSQYFGPNRTEVPWRKRSQDVEKKFTTRLIHHRAPAGSYWEGGAEISKRAVAGTGRQWKGSEGVAYPTEYPRRSTGARPIKVQNVKPMPFAIFGGNAMVMVHPSPALFEKSETGGWSMSVQKYRCVVEGMVTFVFMKRQAGSRKYDKHNRVIFRAKASDLGSLLYPLHLLQLPSQEVPPTDSQLPKNGRARKAQGSWPSELLIQNKEDKQTLTIRRAGEDEPEKIVISLTFPRRLSPLLRQEPSSMRCPPPQSASCGRTEDEELGVVGEGLNGAEEEIEDVCRNKEGGKQGGAVKPVADIEAWSVKAKVSDFTTLQVLLCSVLPTIYGWQALANPSVLSSFLADTSATPSAHAMEENNHR